MNKTKVTIISIFILFLIFWLLKTSLKRAFFDIAPHEAIPTTTALFVELADQNKWKEIPEKYPVYAEFQKIPLFQAFNEGLSDLYLLLAPDSNSIQAFQSFSLTAALQSSGIQQVDFLYVFDNHSDFPIEENLSALSHLTINKHQFQGNYIYHLKGEKGKTIALAIYKNLILVGKLAVFVEDALNQLEHPSTNLCHDKNFKTVSEKRHNTDLRCYINYKAFPIFFDSFIHPKRKTELSNIQNFLRWSSFDLSYYESNIDFQLQTAITPLSSIAKLNKDTLEHHLSSVLPDNVAIMLQTKLDIRTIKGEVFSTYFAPWMTGNIVYATIEPFSLSTQSEKIALFEMKDDTTARHLLNKYANEVGKLSSYPYQMFSIQKILANDIMKPLFGDGLNAIQNPYYTIIDNYVLFSNSRSCMEIWLDKYIVGQTLANQSSFLEFQQDAKPSALSIYVNISKILELIKIYINENLHQSVAKQFNIIKKVSQLKINVEPSLKKYTGKGSFQLKSTIEKQTSIVWKTPLENKAAIAPVILNNPVTGAYEILIQDASNTLYLLNRAGEIIWEKSLDDQILSDIEQIDYYKNGNLQFLFNTASYIYLLDRKGHEVSSFPLKLQSPATNGMLLVDFNDTKHYSYFVACTNKNIYGFDQSGIPLPGWNPKRNIGLVRHPIRHFQKDAKDYLVILTEAGQLHVLQRNGEKRFNAHDFSADFNSPPFFQSHTALPRIVATNTRGKAFITNLQGQHFSLSLKAGTSKNIKFAFADMVGDDRKDYIVLNEDDLLVYYYDNKNIKKAFEYQFQSPQDQVFSIQLDGHKKAFLGTLSTNKKQIFILNERGELLPDFPLAGTTKFEVVRLLNDNKLILIVAKDNSVYAYRIFEEKDK